ncbi:MAG TPA: hypothetical protein VFE14_13305 [Micromonosporaceae bacterium]|nr:hypothetical protein [Micromonosporaceae bacterium]
MNGRGGSVNGAGFVDAACVRYYRTIRADVPASAAQIGFGVNKTAPAPTVRRWLTALYAQLFHERVTDYSTPDDVRERALVAELAGRYLGVPGLDPDAVHFCNGTTEAISIVYGFAAQRGLGTVLPLPLYCSFEQSAARYGVPVVAYYNASGHASPPGYAAGPLLVVDIAPNGVAGSWFDLPTVAGEPELRVVDHVFALPTYQPRAEFLANLRRRIGGDLSKTAVFLTPSKDLSIPGLRCGTIITGHPGLRAYAGADRFERGYTTQVGTARIAAVHLALLLVAFAEPGSHPAVWAELREAFTAAGLAFPGERDCLAYLAHLAGMRRRFVENIGQIDRAGFLAPLGGTQVAGYSGFRTVEAAPDPAAFTGWIHSAGRSGLKLNPNFLFGGDPRLWEALYPGCRGIRVNVSVHPEQLAIDLATLRKLLDSENIDGLR